MEKYDAFGREIGEDPLAAWRTEEGAPREALPADEPPPPAAEPAPPAAEPAPPAAEPAPAAAAQPAPRRAAPPERVVRVHMPAARRRRPRVVSRLIVLLVVLGLGATLVANAGREIEDAIRDVPGVEAEPAGPPPAGLQSGSLVRPGELRRALARLRSEDLGRAYTLRLDPERIDAQLVTPRGVMTSVQLRHDGGFDEFARSRGGGHLDTIPWNRLDPDAPARLARRAAARLGRPVTRLNYLVASLFDGRVIWGAYFKGGQIFQGDERGRLFRRIS